MRLGCDTSTNGLCLALTLAGPPSIDVGMNFTFGMLPL